MRPTPTRSLPVLSRLSVAVSRRGRASQPAGARDVAQGSAANAERRPGDPPSWRSAALVAALGGALSTACGAGEQMAPLEPMPPPVHRSAVVADPSPAETIAPAPETPKASLAELQLDAIRAWMDALSAKDPAKMAAIYSEDARLEVAGFDEAVGRTAIAEEARGFTSAFSTPKVGVVRLFQKGDMATIEWVFTGALTGTYAGMKGAGRDVGVRGASVFFFGPDGLVRSEHRYVDVPTILSQGGATRQRVRAPEVLPTTPEVHSAKPRPSDEQNVETARAAYTAMEQRSKTDFLALLADDVTYDDYTLSQTQRGKASAGQFFGMITRAFPDMRLVPVATAGIDEFALVEYTFTGTHKGPIAGAKATGKPVRYRGFDVWEVREGKLVRAWRYANGLELAQQVGLAKGSPEAR